MSNLSGSAADDPRVLLSTARVTSLIESDSRNAEAWLPAPRVSRRVTFGAIPFSRYGGHPTDCSSVQGRGSVCLIHSSLALWWWPIALLVSVRVDQLVRPAGVRAAGGVGARAVAAVRGRRRHPHGARAPHGGRFRAAGHPAFLLGTLRVGPNEPSRFLYRIASPAGVIGLALLLLAVDRVRSRPLLIVTVVYPLVAVSTVGINGFPHPTPWAFLPHLVIDGSVLLIGGILLAATQGTE